MSAGSASSSTGLQAGRLAGTTRKLQPAGMLRRCPRKHLQTKLRLVSAALRMRLPRLWQVPAHQALPGMLCSQ